MNRFVMALAVTLLSARLLGVEPHKNDTPTTNLRPMTDGSENNEAFENSAHETQEVDNTIQAFRDVSVGSFYEETGEKIPSIPDSVAYSKLPEK